MLAGYWLAYAHFLAGNALEARSLLLGCSSGAACCRTLPWPPTCACGCSMALGWVASDQEDHAAAVAYLEEARALTTDLDDRRRARCCRCWRPAAPRPVTWRAPSAPAWKSLALYRTVEARHEAAILENNLAMAYLRVGNLARASEYAAEARRLHEADHDRRSLAHVLETEAQIALASGDTPSALSTGPRGHGARGRQRRPAGPVELAADHRPGTCGGRRHRCRHSRPTPGRSRHSGARDRCPASSTR